MEKQYDVIVIGAGVGGLAAAGLLAKAGQRVLVLERHSVVGGYCSTFRRAHFIFDAAVHALGGCAPGDIIHQWCTELGVSNNELRFIDLHPFYTVEICGEQIEMPANLDDLAQTLSQRFPSDRTGLQALIAEMKLEGQAAIATNFQDTPVRSPKQSQLARLSWLEYLSSYLTEPQLITLLSGLCIYGGVEPQHASALFMIAMFYSYHQGAYYPMGSTQRFVDTLAQAIRRHGGTIRRRATVQKILVDRREGVTGVQLTTGEEFTAHTVISNADATKTLNTMLTDGQLPNSLQRRLKRAEYGPSAVALYLAVRDGEWSTRIQSHETFYLPDWQPLTAKHFYYRPGQPSHPYVFSLSVPSLSEPALAPAGHHVISLTGLAHTAEIEQIREEQGKAVIEQDICAHLERLLPGVNACIIYREVATPRTFERYTSNGQGAIYGWAKNTQHFTNGLSIQSPIKGLYLAGHWTQGAHGVYGSFLAGVAVAQKIQRAQRISRQFQLAANL